MDRIFGLGNWGKEDFQGEAYFTHLHIYICLVYLSSKSLKLGKKGEL